MPTAGHACTNTNSTDHWISRCHQGPCQIPELVITTRTLNPEHGKDQIPQMLEIDSQRHHRDIHKSILSHCHTPMYLFYIRSTEKSACIGAVMGK